MPRSRPVDGYQEPPDDALLTPQPPLTVPAAVIASTIETLSLLDEFFRRHASSTTRAELHAFTATKGWHPVQGAEVPLSRASASMLSASPEPATQ
jgi:hypothetical protein